MATSNSAQTQSTDNSHRWKRLWKLTRKLSFCLKGMNAIMSPRDSSAQGLKTQSRTNVLLLGADPALLEQTAIPLVSAIHRPKHVGTTMVSWHDFSATSLAYG